MDYKKALEALNRFVRADFSNSETRRCLANEIENHYSTIRHALKLADKIMQEPSREMKRWAGSKYALRPETSSGVFTAMRDQALKEMGKE